MRKTSALSWGYVLGALVALTGCDEEKTLDTAATTTASPPQVTPPPAAPPAAEPEPETKTPTKKLEDCAPGPKVSFENAEIEAHLRMKSEKPKGDLTTTDLGRITSVNFSRIPLDTLDPCLFHHMKSLKELFLAPGKVWDLSPLEGLVNLETVRIAGNPVDDLTPLTAMKKMDRLDIGNTMVKDLSPAKEWTRLTEVTLDGSLVEDISALSDAKDLETLSVKRTKIKDLSALEGHKKLETLFIAESALADNYGATGAVAKNGTKVISD
jgi:internalin A